MHSTNPAPNHPTASAAAFVRLTDATTLGHEARDLLRLARGVLGKLGDAPKLILEKGGP